MNAIEKMKNNGLIVNINDIMDVIVKYSIKELSVFGSSIRSDFNEKSDIDLIVVFENTQDISLLDLIDIQNTFEAVFGRKVDLVEPDGLTNPIRRKAILESKEILYAA